MSRKQTTLAEAQIGDFIEFRGVEGRLINKRITSSCASRGNRYELDVRKELKERTVTGYDTDSVGCTAEFCIKQFSAEETEARLSLFSSDSPDIRTTVGRDRKLRVLLLV